MSGAAIDLGVLAPVLWTAAAAGGVLLLDLFLKPGDDRTPVLYLGLGGIVLAILSMLELHGREGAFFHGTLVVDRFGLFAGIVAAAATGLSFLTSISYVRRFPIAFAEFFALALLGLSGMLLLSLAGEWLTLLVALETISVAFYILTASNAASSRSAEGGLRYFLLGALATALLVFGIALVYGATGTTRIAASAVAEGDRPLHTLGLGFLIAGFAFKVGAVPFHMWVPDAYEGAPTAVSGLMASGVKAASFAAFLRAITAGFGGGDESVSTVLAWLSGLSMTLGNVMALSQSNLKRLLGYSSIAHTGYLLIGFQTAAGKSAVLFYLAAYALSALGAFGVLIAAGRDDEDLEETDQLAGLGRRKPLLGAAMALFLFSLVGVPPTGGFVAKLLVFRSALQEGHIFLPLLGVLTSVVSLYYYLAVVKTMYFREPEREFFAGGGRLSLSFALAMYAGAVLLLGILPDGLIAAALRAAG